MKIGFDAKRAFHNKSGLGNYSRDLIRILSNSWVNDEFFLFNPKKKEDVFTNLPSNVTEVNPEKAWKKSGVFWRRFAISKILKKKNIAVYHGLSNELPKNMEDTNSIVTIHDLIFERFPEWYSSIDVKIYRKKFKSAAEKANTVIAISEQTKLDLVSYYNIPAERIKVVYQGCHNAFKTDLDEDTIYDVADKFSLPSKFILYVGTIEERKNLMTVLKAIEQHEEIDIVTVGRKTNYAKQIDSYIEDSALNGRVHHLSNISMEELAAVYRLAHTFVYPSQFEGFGIPIIEALFSKTAVITSTGSCFSEAGGPDSTYLKYNDVEAWEEAILAHWNDDDLVESKGEKGFEYAQKFTDEAILKNWEEIYAKYR